MCKSDLKGLVLTGGGGQLISSPIASPPRYPSLLFSSSIFLLPFLPSPSSSLFSFVLDCFIFSYLLFCFFLHPSLLPSPSHIIASSSVFLPLLSFFLHRSFPPLLLHCFLIFHYLVRFISLYHFARQSLKFTTSIYIFWHDISYIFTTTLMKTRLSSFHY